MRTANLEQQAPTEYMIRDRNDGLIKDILVSTMPDRDYSVSLTVEVIVAGRGESIATNALNLLQESNDFIQIISLNQSPEKLQEALVHLGTPIITDGLLFAGKATQGLSAPIRNPLREYAHYEAGCPLKWQDPRPAAGLPDDLPWRDTSSYRRATGPARHLTRESLTPRHRPTEDPALAPRSIEHVLVNGTWRQGHNQLASTFSGITLLTLKP